MCAEFPVVLKQTLMNTSCPDCMVVRTYFPTKSRVWTGLQFLSKNPSTPSSQDGFPLIQLSNLRNRACLWSPTHTGSRQLPRFNAVQLRKYFHLVIWHTVHLHPLHCNSASRCAELHFNVSHGRLHLASTASYSILKISTKI